MRAFNLKSLFNRVGPSARLWFDSYSDGPELSASEENQIQWIRILPMILLHLACLSIIWVGFSWTAFSLAVLFFLSRMFFITAFYHRYFSHRAYKTNRLNQFVFAVLGNTALQRGALWWAAHHRNHHQTSDQEDDEHSPDLKGFIWSHILWFTTQKNFRTRSHLIRDWNRYPELVFLDRFALLVPVVLFILTYVVGAGLEYFLPQLQTNGWQMIVWVYVISTVVLMHATFTINSLAHVWGQRRYATEDTSRNNLVLALLTLGEGWHNNHHFFPASARQGFFPHEVDMTYWGLQWMERLGLIWDLKEVPQFVLEQGKESNICEAA